MQCWYELWVHFFLLSADSNIWLYIWIWPAALIESKLRYARIPSKLETAALFSTQIPWEQLDFNLSTLAEKKKKILKRKEKIIA